MRVLFVTNDYPTDNGPGNSPCVRQQLEDLGRLGIDTDLLYINTRKNKLNYLRGIMSVFWNSQVKNRFDLIHGHYGYCGLVARAQLRCPVVTTFRGSDVLLARQRHISRLVARISDQVIVMTEEMKGVLRRTDAHVIPYGVDLDTFCPVDGDGARRELDLSIDDRLVLFPYDKNRSLKKYDLAEAAIGILVPEFPKLTLLTIHDKPPSVVAKYMNACDAMILTSESEGAPVAVREALACNLPIVSVDVGDVAAAIQGVEWCYLAQRNPEDIAQKLRMVLRARERSNGRLSALRMSSAQSAHDVATAYRYAFLPRSSH